MLPDLQQMYGDIDIETVKEKLDTLKRIKKLTANDMYYTELMK